MILVKMLQKGCDKMFKEKCVIDEDKICNSCQDCMICDLNANKICDNCCQCLENNPKDFETIVIDDIVI